MVALLAILFAISFRSEEIGFFWRLPSWCPNSTLFRDTPGSDNFSREGHDALDTTSAAGFYSILDGFDSRSFIFTRASTPTNEVSDRGISHYDDFLIRKNAMRSNIGMFGSGGEMLEQYADSHEYRAFGNFSWTEDPYLTAGAGVGWFPQWRSLPNDGCFKGEAREGGLAWEILREIGANDAVLDHDPTGEIFDFTADDVLEKSFARCNPSDVLNDSRVISWKPLEITAQALSLHDRAYDVLPSGSVYMTLSNATVNAKAIRNYAGGVKDGLLTVRCQSSEQQPTISFVEGASHSVLPIGEISFATNIYSTTVEESPASSPMAKVGSLNALIQVNAYGIIGQRNPSLSELEAFLYNYMISRGMTSIRVFGHTNANNVDYHLKMISGGVVEDLVSISDIENRYIVGTYSPPMACEAVSEAGYSAKSWMEMMGMKAVKNEHKIGPVEVGIGDRFRCVSSCYSTASTNNPQQKTGVVACRYKGHSYNGQQLLDECVADSHGGLVSQAFSQIQDITGSPSFLNPAHYMGCYQPEYLAASATNLVIGGVVFDRCSATGTVTVTEGGLFEYHSEDEERPEEAFLSQYLKVWVTDTYSEKMRPSASVVTQTKWVQESDIHFPQLSRSENSGRGYGVLDLSAQTAKVSQYENAYGGCRYVGIDANDPVVYAKRRAFYNAFSGCQNAEFALFDKLLEAGESSFELAFFGCTSMTNASFNGLPNAGDRAFRQAFAGTKVKETNFASLTNCGERAFEYAFCNNTNLVDVLFTNLVSAGEGAFCCAFTNADFYAVTNLSFPKLAHIPSNFLYHAFGESDDPFTGLNLVNVRRMNFHSATGIVSDAISFGICTNAEYASFDNLQGGVVNMFGSYADRNTSPLVVSASNVSASVVVDVSKCSNLREVRFDEVQQVVNFDSRWIPGNSDFKIIVNRDIAAEWMEAPGWSNYATNIFASDGSQFTKWVATSDLQSAADLFNAQPNGGLLFEDYGEGEGPWYPKQEVYVHICGEDGYDSPITTGGSFDATYVEWEFYTVDDVKVCTVVWRRRRIGQ